MIKNQKAYFLTEYQVAALNCIIGARLEILDSSLNPQLMEEERAELTFILHALTHPASITIESLMIENHQLRNRIQGLELEKAVNKLEKEEKEENIPCIECGRDDLDLHFNRQCGECREKEEA